ncbi:MAG: M20 aminoacylase family protein [Granulosicoccaceae bacterium]
MSIDSRIAALVPEITEWRQDMHKHPELDFDVHRTASFVADKLREFGCDEVVEGIGRTGVVGVIKGSVAGNQVIGMRADMDALPIEEETGVSYSSTNEGLMHACGHDGHTAMLLGAAKAMCATRQFAGSVVVIFQPAEEASGGGREMVEDGLFERFGIQSVYGMHNLPGIPVGHFGLRDGPIMAAADMFDIIIEGKAGHAAMPQLCVDSTYIAAQVINAIQAIASRVVDPLQPVVISITGIQSDSNAYNIIPQRVTMRGTLRALSEPVRKLAETQLISVVENVAAAHGAKGTVDYDKGYPPTISTADHTRFATQVARTVAGDEAVDANAPALMAAEDFSYMLDASVGNYCFLGNGDSHSLHHPKYNFNDDAIAYGSSYWLALAEQGLPISPS